MTRTVEGNIALLSGTIRRLISNGWVIVLCSMPVHAQQLAIDEWQSQLNADHPLVGKIWSSAENSFIEEADLYENITRSHFLLVGEKHDNPDHHQIHQNLVARLLSEQRLETLSMEMLDSNQQKSLDELTANSVTNEEQVKTQLQWDEDGWDWSFYSPILLAVLKNKVHLQAANITSEQMMEVYQGELHPDASSALNAAAVKKLNEDIDESHCGLLPASQFPSMVRVQQARDYQMAQSMLINIGGVNEKGLAPRATNSSSDDPARIRMLIAGNYHIRRDLGVPNYLLSSGATTEHEIVSVALLEVENEVVDGNEYLQRFSNVDAYDYIWFTPAISDEDYCASLRKTDI